jgi:hypothetical protein
MVARVGTDHRNSTREKASLLATRTSRGPTVSEAAGAVGGLRTCATLEGEMATASIEASATLAFNLLRR